MRGCWSFSLSSFSLATSDTAVLARRICMIVVLALRTAISVWDVVWSGIKVQIVGLIISCILGVLGFFFIAWCLARIGEATGYRRVLGARVVSVLVLLLHHWGSCPALSIPTGAVAR
jgi:hypothetical protein